MCMCIYIYVYILHISYVVHVYIGFISTPFIFRPLRPLVRNSPPPPGKKK